MQTNHKLPDNAIMSAILIRYHRFWDLKVDSLQSVKSVQIYKGQNDIFFSINFVYLLLIVTLMPYACFTEDKGLNYGLSLVDLQIDVFLHANRKNSITAFNSLVWL